jgi:hypothetical protein
VRVCLELFFYLITLKDGFKNTYSLELLVRSDLMELDLIKRASGESSVPDLLVRLLVSEAEE